MLCPRSQIGLAPRYERGTKVNGGSSPLADTIFLFASSNGKETSLRNSEWPFNPAREDQVRRCQLRVSAAAVYGEIGVQLSASPPCRRAAGSNPPLHRYSEVAKLAMHLAVNQAMRRFDSCPRSQFPGVAWAVVGLMAPGRFYAGYAGWSPAPVLQTGKERDRFDAPVLAQVRFQRGSIPLPRIKFAFERKPAANAANR